MKNLFALFIILLVTIQPSFSQKNEISEDEKDFIYSMKLEMTKNLFKKPNYSFEKIKFDQSKRLVKSEKKVAEIIESIDFFNKNAKIELTKNGKFKKVVLTSKFPESFSSEKLGVIDIKMIENRLLGNNSKKLKTMNAESTSFNFKITHENQLSFDSEFEKNLTGSVSYKISFITDYLSYKISKKNIGEIIKLNNRDYKIIDVYNNKIIIELTSETKLNFDDLKTIIINFDETGKNELVSKSQIISSSLIDKEVYNLLRKNNKLDLKSFRSKFKIERLLDNTINGKYIVLETQSPINENTILYTPIYGIERTIKIKL